MSDQPQPQYFLIEANLAQAVMTYLGKQPYEESFTFIEMMKGMKPAAFPAKAPDDKGGATGHNGAAQENKKELKPE